MAATKSSAFAAFRRLGLIDQAHATLALALFAAIQGIGIWFRAIIAARELHHKKEELRFKKQVFNDSQKVK
jgi:hypothetical protein